MVCTLNMYAPSLLLYIFSLQNTQPSILSYHSCCYLFIFYFYFFLFCSADFKAMPVDYRNQLQLPGAFCFILRFLFLSLFSVPFSQSLRLFLSHFFLFLYHFLLCIYWLPIRLETIIKVHLFMYNAQMILIIRFN